MIYIHVCVLLLLLLLAIHIIHISIPFITSNSFTVSIYTLIIQELFGQQNRYHKMIFKE